MEIFLGFSGVWGLLPAFSRYSVRTVPHVDVFFFFFCRCIFDVFVKGGELHVLLLRHLDSEPLYDISAYLPVWLCI